MDLRELQTSQLDGLREVANIGAGHAATALSQLTGRRVSIEVPEVSIVRLEDVGSVVGEPDEVVSAVLMRILGDITGRTVQVFPAPTASRLAGMLLGRDDPGFPDGFGELEQSTLKEVGNIIVGAYLNALSDFMGMLLIMSVPALAIDMAAAVLATTYINFGDTTDDVFCVNVTMHMEGSAELPAHFLLIPDRASLKVLLRALRLV